jgi:hypothetical protein
MPGMSKIAPSEPLQEFEYIAQDFGSSRWLVGGTQDNGTDRWTGPGTWEHVEDADGGDCAVNRTSPNIVFHSRQQWQLLRSTSRGDWGSWTFISPPQGPGEGSLFYAPFEASASGGNTIAYGGDNLHVSRDNGTSWTLLSLAAGERSTALAVPNSDRVVIGTWNGNLYRTQWSGSSWSTPTQLTSPRPGAYISDVYVLPSDLNCIWVTSSMIGGGRVFRSDDGRTTWTDHSAGTSLDSDHLFDIVEVEPKALLIHAESFYGGCTSFTETSKKLDSFGCIWSSPTDSDPGIK